MLYLACYQMIAKFLNDIEVTWKRHINDIETTYWWHTNDIKRGKRDPYAAIRGAYSAIRVPYWTISAAYSLSLGSLFIPSVGIFYSQRGNALFPTWEFSARYLPDGHLYGSSQNKYKLFMSLVCRFYVIFMSFIKHVAWN